MPRIFLLTLLFFCSLNGFSQGFLITQNGDRLPINKPLDVESKDIASWKEVSLDGKSYSTKELRAMMLDGDYYTVIRGRFWKRVIHGKLNVYALHDKDTLCNEDGIIRKKLFLQSGDEGIPVLYTNKNLYKLSPPSANEFVHTQVNKYRSGMAMQIPGIIITGASGVVLLFGGMAYLFAPEDETIRNILASGTVGVLAGAGLITSGSFLRREGKKVSLKPVEEFNRK